jgi:hypothetical protein
MIRLAWVCSACSWWNAEERVHVVSTPAAGIGLVSGLCISRCCGPSQPTALTPTRERARYTSVLPWTAVGCEAGIHATGYLGSPMSLCCSKGRVGWDVPRISRRVRRANKCCIGTAQANTAPYSLPFPSIHTPDHTQSSIVAFPKPATWKKKKKKKGGGRR